MAIQYINRSNVRAVISITLQVMLGFFKVKAICFCNRLTILIQYSIHSGAHLSSDRRAFSLSVIVFVRQTRHLYVCIECDSRRFHFLPNQAMTSMRSQSRFSNHFSLLQDVTQETRTWHFVETLKNCSDFRVCLEPSFCRV